jgi:putative transposase
MSYSMSSKPALQGFGSVPAGPALCNWRVKGSWGLKTLYIEPGSPWENAYIEPLNGKPRDELLNVEIFTTLFEARVLIENWRKDYNQFRPHSAFGYRPPASEALLPGYASTS